MDIAITRHSRKYLLLFGLAVLCVAACCSLTGCGGSSNKGGDAELVSYEDPSGVWSTMRSDRFSVDEGADGSVFTITNSDGDTTYGTIAVDYVKGENASDWLADERQDAVDGKFGKVIEGTSVSEIEPIELEGHDCSSVYVVIDDGNEGMGYYFVGDNCKNGLMKYTLCFTQSGFDGVNREFTNLITNMEMK